MARLGKRERKAKRDRMISALNAREVSERRVIRDRFGSLQVVTVQASVNHCDTLLRGTHTPGFRDPRLKVRYER